MMERNRWIHVRTAVLLCGVLLAWRTAAGAPTMQLGNDTALVGQTVEIPLTLSTTDEVQGLVAVFHWNGTLGSGVDLLMGSDVMSIPPDFWVTRVESDYMVLGLVVDYDGVGPQSFGPGLNLHIATAVIKGIAPGVSPVVFVDGSYATVPGGPPLDNVVVIGGLSIGQAEGLILTNGSFTIEAIPAPGALLLCGIGLGVVRSLRRRRSL